MASRVADALGGDQRRYRVVEYIDAMGDAIAAADVVVARAGATSIAEITAIGRAAVLVPYPYATDDHQTLNARAVAEAGGAELVPDDELGSDRFRDVVLGSYATPGGVRRWPRHRRHSAGVTRRSESSLCWTGSHTQ